VLLLPPPPLPSSPLPCRSVPHDVRWTLYNVTMVLSQDSEMSYVTYMFTLYSSPLQYLKAQTEFYSSVLHISILQVRAWQELDDLLVNRWLGVFPCQCRL
jgi:hypothetical protein